MGSLQLEECGRVLSNANRSLFALDCVYCEKNCKQMFTQWVDFIGHVSECHKLTKTQQETTPILQEFIVETVIQESIGLQHEIVDDQECVEYLDDTEEGMDYLTETEMISGPLEENDTEIALNEDPIKAEDNMLPSVAISFESNNEAFIKDFIENMKKYDCLWNIKYNCKNYTKERQTAFKNISETLDIDKKSTELSVNYILKWYKGKYLTQYANQATNNEIVIKEQANDKNAKYFKMCEFLVDSIPNKKYNKTKFQKSLETYNCNFCDKIFSRKYYLDVHLRRHTKEFPFKCELCNKLTATSGEMITHMRYHNGERPYTCSTCGKTYKTSSMLCQHIRRHEKPTVQCPQCPKAYYNNHHLKIHTNSAHSNRRDYKCEFCLKMFASSKGVTSHKRTSHTQLRKSFCKYCKKCFPHIDYHMKTEHSQES